MIVTVLEQWYLINEVGEYDIGAVEYRWTCVVSPSNVRVGVVVQVGTGAIAGGCIRRFGVGVAELKLQVSCYISVHVNLQRVVAAIGLVLSQADSAVAEIVIVPGDASTTRGNQ